MQTQTARMVIKKIKESNCWRGCRERGTLMYFWWETAILGIFKKLKIELPYDPAAC